MNRRRKIFTVVLVLLLLLLIGLWWLSLLLMTLVLLYFVFLKLIYLIKCPFYKKLVRGLFLLLFIFLMAISAKLLLINVYKIPSSSMNNTLYTNDVIFVDKLKYGPKLPRSPFEIPWLNIAFYFNDNARKRIKENWWPYKRLSGYSTIKNGDVVVFTMPFGNDITIVKRCMAIAGDTLSIKNGNVYINNTFFSPSNFVLNKYEFRVNNRKSLYRTLDSLNLDIYLNRASKDNFIASLSSNDKEMLKETGIIKDLIRVLDSLNLKSKPYPNSKYTQWSLDNYGPYIIPKKGMTIHLNPKNYALYYKVINEHEGAEILDIDGGYVVKGRQVTTYTFDQDYYFMMGDNRKGSIDSRSWGLVPEKRIIGKVQCVLWSNYQDEFQWNRLLKKVE